MGMLWLDPDSVAVLILATSAVVLGLLGIFERARPPIPDAARQSSSRHHPVLGPVTAALALFGAGVALVVRVPGIVALAAAIPAASYLLLWAARTYHARLVPLVAALLRARLLHAALLLGTGPLLACLWALHKDETATAEMYLPAADETLVDVFQSIKPVSEPAFTDRGQQIPLFSVSADPQAPAFGHSEAVLGRSLPLRLLHTAAPDPSCNCHGWIFTGGRFWVNPRDVDQILTDNDYTETSEPRPGDLVLYRNAGALADGNTGSLTHSGIVRFVENELILIESKFGPLGCYLHAPADQNYASAWMFYHSPRHGHVLRIGTKKEPEQANDKPAN